MIGLQNKLNKKPRKDELCQAGDLLPSLQLCQIASILVHVMGPADLERTA
jgi:hypothetical protein